MVGSAVAARPHPNAKILAAIPGRGGDKRWVIGRITVL